MKNKFYSLKDFKLSTNKEVGVVINDFQEYINQMLMFNSKSYWIESQKGVGSTMFIESQDLPVSAFIANDYLGMSQREETIEAGIEALKKYGTGACAAQAISGYLDIHKKLEQSIAEFVGLDDAILFSFGFGANTGLLRAILGKNDIAYTDSYIHTSANSGLIGTNIKPIGHNDVEYLEMTLKNNVGKYNTQLVIIDGVYSQDGDLSKLPEYIEVCKRYNVLLMVDDAHGIGVMGKTGRGTCEHFDCMGKVDIITGTFSKSFGCVGGFVAASKK